jgi:hypothetical protein
VDFHLRPSHSDSLDQEAHEPLALLEVEDIDALSNAVGKGVNPAC